MSSFTAHILFNLPTVLPTGKERTHRMGRSRGRSLGRSRGRSRGRSQGRTKKQIDRDA